MANYSLNKVILIGNLTRDPELRYTPSGTAVCNFGLATNRQWTDSEGNPQEDTEFHRIVAWGKLAEICSQLLFTGRKVYVEGRLQTREWTAKDGTERATTEIVIRRMLALDEKRPPREEATTTVSKPSAKPAGKKTTDEDEEEVREEEEEKKDKEEKGEKEKEEEKGKKKDKGEDEEKEEVKKEDIPF